MLRIVVTVLLVLAAARVSAEHTVYYRYVVLGFVKDAQGKFLPGREVEVVRNKTGLVYSASLFALKTGTMVAGWMLPLVLDRFGFVPKVAQSESALLGILLAFSVGPGIWSWSQPREYTNVRETEKDFSVGLG